MADNQAMGAALYQLGQGISGASDAYFGGQIKAAQIAQATALKTMQAQAQMELKQNANAETAKYHADTIAQRAAAEAAREKEAAAKQNQTDLYQKGELGIRGKEVANTDAFHKAQLAQGEEKIKIEREKADKAAGGKPTALQKGLTIANREVKNAEEAMKAALPAGVDPNTLSGAAKENYLKVKTQLNDAMQKRSVLTKQLQQLGALQPPPLGDPGASEQDRIDSGANLGVAPANPPAQATTKPASAKAPANIPSGAIAYLKQNDSPLLRQQFDQKYGQGSAASVLGE